MTVTINVTFAASEFRFLANTRTTESQGNCPLNDVSTQIQFASDFATLDYDAQIARFDALVARAVQHFGLDVAETSLQNYTNNAVYRLDSHDGQRFALRIHRPGLKKRAWIESELVWLKALIRDTSLRVPQPAAPIYTGKLEGVDLPVYCVLFRWLDGDSYKPNALTPQHAYAVGQFAAYLHNHSTHYIPGDGFERPRLDYEGLFGDESPYNPGVGDAIFNATQRRVMTEAGSHIREVMGQLDAQPGSFGLIHADLIWKNVLFEEGSIAAIDFDDCAFGYALYDLSPMLLSFKDEPEGAELSNSLWEGYRSMREHAQSDRAPLEALIAARHIASIRWIAGNLSNPSVRDRAPEIIADRIERLQHFVQTGVL